MSKKPKTRELAEATVMEFSTKHEADAFRAAAKFLDHQQAILDACDEDEPTTHPCNNPDYRGAFVLGVGVEYENNDPAEKRPFRLMLFIHS